MAKKRVKTKINKTDILFLGAGAIAAFVIYKAVSGGESEGGSWWTGGGSGGQTDSSGAPFVAKQWSDSFETYCIPGCYLDCSYRYDILAQIQEKLSDSQIKEVSDALRSSTGKNMYQLMAEMTWFGGPYTNNKAEALFSRLSQISL